MNDLSVIFPRNTVINEKALARVTGALPMLIEQTKAFDRNNSQTTLAMMSLTMLNGQSPFRLLRQVLAEVERRRMALAEAQHGHAKQAAEIDAIPPGTEDPVLRAELRMRQINLEVMEGKINGAVKDIAVLADAYENIKARHNIGEWDEAVFEEEEKRHHVRRGFELLYRYVLESGHPREAATEYLQQFGVHPQIAFAEVSGYINFTNERISRGERMTATDLENFLDAMASKYAACADEASERLFGKADFANKDFMMRSSRQ